ncbi:hypothetical protein [Chitinophaga sp. YIM B06452]|uniref:hypothetical protein n=1 Tax=Chitinophaga sp. YIM B06452 TaxID=3082158 RepID=UPI0031FF0D01
MRVVLFFVCLFSLLLGRGVAAFAGVHHHSAHYSIASRADNTRHAKFPNIHRHRTKVRETDVEKGTEQLITEKVEDEDTSSSSARKYKLLARCFLALSSPSILSYLHNRFKTPPPFAVQLSDKYIVQRTLRI